MGEEVPAAPASSVRPGALPWIVASIWGGSFLLYLFGLRLFGEMLPSCGMKRFFGVPCPTCRGTRSGFALLRGDVVEAYHWNPLVATALLASPVLVAVWLLGGFRRFRPSARFWSGCAFALAAAVLLNWIYVWKMGG